MDGGRVYAACLILAFKLKSLTAAKVTAITAMIISSGMILLAIISLFITSYGNELFLGLVGVFVFYEVQGHAYVSFQKALPNKCERCLAKLLTTHTESNTPF